MVMDTNPGDGVYDLLLQLNEYLWPHDRMGSVHTVFMQIGSGGVRRSAVEVKELAKQLREAADLADQLLQAITS